MLAAFLTVLMAGGTASALADDLPTLTEHPPLKVGMSKAEVLSALQKPEHTDHGKCSIPMPDCPSGHKWEMLHYNGLDVRLLDGKVIKSSLTTPHGKTSKLDSILTGIAIGLYVTQEAYYAYYCPQIRKVPIIFMNANQLEFLQACIAAGY